VKLPSKATNSSPVLERPRILSHPVPGGLLADFREGIVMRLVRALPPLPFSAIMHARYQHRFSLFRKPKRYSELVNRKKLYDRDPLLTTTADKYAVREYVAATIGEHYLIPLQQVVDDPKDIDWPALHGRVVVKGTHGCNMTMMLNADAPVDCQHVQEVANRWLALNWYNVWKEWAYKNIPPRLVIENFIGENDEPPADFKFHVFNGRVELVQVDTDRFRGHKSTLLSPDWRELVVGASFGTEQTPLEKPEKLEEMRELAEKLAQPFDYVRIDFYNVDGRIYFGEITHYPGAVSVKFNPPSFDDALGELWRNSTPIPAEYYVSK
jgi:hypothetical protein